jgi:hypothetical protein
MPDHRAQANAERRRELLAATDAFLAELVKEVGEPTPEELDRASRFMTRSRRE